MITGTFIWILNSFKKPHIHLTCETKSDQQSSITPKNPAANEILFKLYMPIPSRTSDA